MTKNKKLGKKLGLRGKFLNRRPARDLKSSLVEIRSQHKAQEHFPLLKQILFRVVDQVVPDKVVAKIFTGNAIETVHKLLESAVEAVDVLNMEDSFFRPSRLDLDQIDIVRLAESAIRVKLVRYHRAPRFDPSIVDLVQILGRNPSEGRNLGDGETVTVHSTGNTHFFAANSAQGRTMATLMRRPRHGKRLAALVIPFVGNREEGFIRLYDSVKNDAVCHDLECVQNFMPPNKRSVVVNTANVGSFPKRKTAQHAVGELFPGFDPFARTGNNGVGGYKEGLSTLAANIALLATAFPVSNDMGTAAKRAHSAAFEPLAFDESFHADMIAAAIDYGLFDGIMFGDRETVKIS